MRYGSIKNLCVCRILISLVVDVCRQFIESTITKFYSNNQFSLFSNYSTFTFGLYSAVDHIGRRRYVNLFLRLL